MANSESITAEAKRLLEESFTNLDSERKKEATIELKQEAISEAFLRRGLPVEVTVDDVRKASQFVKADQFESSEQSVSSFSVFMFRMYFALGIFTLFVGLIYSIVPSALDGVMRLYLILIGVILCGASAYFRFFRRTDASER